MTIKLNQYIVTGLTQEDFNQLHPMFREILNIDGEKIIFDFEDVRFFTTLFFSQFINTLLSSVDMNTFYKKYQFVNLTEYGEVLFSRCLNNSVEYYSLPFLG